ncbi:intron Large complex component GCFC2 isoform X3 [Homo sapiens]|nr:intron Large complex component GCFC2 isoform X3 [Homo sapiens]XP_054199551.1 intron Large complex component GCFC2 isoform X3 [Homo sapiens]|eukprot:XP_011531376.1 GC-rich sequence DNA-binding factor 2 isoform X2 [Homo sapiens]
MAHRPKRTFRQRAADSSDSDGAEESPAEPGAPRELPVPGSAEEEPPSGGGRAQVAGLPHRVRGPRGRGRVWASSRRATKAAPRADEGSESRTLDVSTDEEDKIHHSSESKDDQGLSSDSSSSLGEKELSSTVSRNEETSEESQEDEKQDTWEQQQMRKAVKIIEERDIDLSCGNGSSKVKKFDTSISFPPVNLEIIKKQLNTRLTLLQETHRSHLREYEKYVQDVKSSKSTIQNLESSSNQALNCKFYKSMKIYVENLIDCLNEKIINIQEIESSMHALLLKQAMTFMKRRQDELKHESTYLQQLSRKDETSTSGNFSVDEKTQWILEEIESRRTKRRQARVLSGNCNHQEGTSSDDELPSAEMIDFQKSQGDILQKQKKVFEEVQDDFCNIQNILLKFQQWREKFPDSYYEAFISLCIPKLLNPLIRVQLIDWNPLKLESTGLKEMPWFKSVEEFMDSSVEDSKKESSSDKKVLSAIINKTIIPRLTDFVEFLWDPLSTSQTTSLITHCRVILEEHSTCENEVSKSRQDLLKSIVSRMKKAVEDDVFIPLYPKSAVENKTSPHSKFQERQFWSGLKLFRNILLWNGLLTDDTLQELGLGKLLNRYLIIALLNATPGPDVVKKCNQVAACLPEKWFENSAMRTSIPQLENFIQFLLQSAHKLSRSEFRDEVEEIILILVKIKALNQAESFIGEHHLDHLKSLIKED